MHLDESTVAWFAWQLLTGHGYSYDPVYHGPFQHDMLALIFLLFEPSQTSARMLAVVLGTALVALPWFLRDYLGRLAALLSCFLLAISPSFVYFARFERDDTYMEFFTLLIVVLALRFLRDRKPWQLYGTAIALALGFATKESIYIVAFIFGTYLLFHAAGRVARLRPTVLRLRSGTRAMNAVVLSSLGALLAIALILTPVTHLYLPVPALATLIAGLGVLTAATAVGAASRSPAPAEKPWLRRLVSSPWRPHWINAATVAVAIVVLMYSTFGTNLNGLWDRAHPFFDTGHACQYPLAFNLDACRKDIVGGLFYWLSQHKVARGGQPWFYYLLIYGLYEQLAVLLGAFAIIRTLAGRMSPRSRSIRMFFSYWAVLALIVYSWAGEKFPWLGIHPLLPLTVLAAIGLTDVLLMARVLGSSISHKGRSTRRRLSVWVGRVAVMGVVVLLIAEIHNTFVLNYVDGANPVEMMVYVQSSPDTIADANLIGSLSHRATGGTSLAVTIDSIDSWPFAWYLRNMPNVGYPTGPQAVKPPYVSNPIILLDQTDAETFTLPSSVRTGYTRALRRLDWWFPEDYKLWTWPSLGQKAFDLNSWQAIWNWEVYRTPFGPRDGTWYYRYIRKGYFPGF